MKTTMLLFSFLFSCLITAREIIPQESDLPVSFLMDHVSFHIFHDGSFEFDINDVYKQQNVYYDEAIQGSTTVISVSKKYDPYHISYDYHGKVISIGSIYIKYDQLNRVRKIGDIHIRYRHNYLYQVGGLYIYYYPDWTVKQLTGEVYYRNCGYCGHYNCPVDHKKDKHKHKHRHKKKHSKKKHKHHHKKHKHHTH